MQYAEGQNMLFQRNLIPTSTRANGMVLVAESEVVSNYLVLPYSRSAGAVTTALDFGVSFGNKLNRPEDEEPPPGPSIMPSHHPTLEPSYPEHRKWPLQS